MTDKPRTKREKRHIVICCDGTGNEISENISNVLKLYRTLRKTEKTHPNQLVFYDPGVGTLARPNPWLKWRQDVAAIFGLATGYGLDDNILNSYEFIVDNYAEGDDIYLFGFSRGAYTVRALAGLIHKIGLIAKPQGNLAGSGLTAYKQFSSDFGDQAGGLDLKQFTDGGAADVTPSEGRPGGAICPHPQREMADHQIRRGLGHRGQRHRAAAGPVLSAEPADAGLRQAQSLDRDFSPGDLDRRAAAHVPAAAVGRRRQVLAAPLRAERTNGRTRTSCRSGSPACIPISAAAIRSGKARCRNIRCCG